MIHPTQEEHLMPIVDSFLAELDQEAVATRKVLDRVPADKLEWRPHARSMSLGQLAMHIATTPGGIARIASVDVFDFAGINPPVSATVAETLSALEAGLAEARKILGSMDDARLMAIWTAQKDGKTMMSLPRIAVLRALMLNHWYHHRGQLTVYLRMLEVPVPSVYGPSADENPFA